MIEYDAFDTPETSAPMLPVKLDTFTIVFFPLFSTSGRNAWETRAGPATFVTNVCNKSSMFMLNAVSGRRACPSTIPV